MPVALESYRAKRDFAKTREPPGEVAEPSGSLFVVQKHAARRLHYDLRLELDGVLKSWAVTRGPSLIAGEKRLAVHVEDHPLDYARFEGTIPKGEYGAGSVLVWDIGTWEPEGDPHKGYAKGHLNFRLHGRKLHGAWHLVRMRARPRDRTENWLLIKADDEAARPEGDILAEDPRSVLTGRTIEDIGEHEAPASKTVAKRSRKNGPEKKGDVPPAALDPASIKGARRAAMPEFVDPCLATLVDEAPSGSRWVHEIKFDGYRIEARVEEGSVALLTRRGLDWTERFGKDIAAALAALPARSALIDGEVVVETDVGSSDFSAMQADLAEGRTDRFRYYVFDLLHIDGFDLRGAPLLERKNALAALMAAAGRTEPVRLSEHFAEEGPLLLEQACRLSLEGIVSKRAEAPYRSGRGHDWLKVKCTARQEFVVAGYVPSSTGRHAIGSLILGYYDEGRLRYAGRVGTGFSEATARQLWSRLEPLRISAKPFADRLSADETRGARWTKPVLVADVEFRGWTASGNIRHASFRGLREDKPAEEVTREDGKAEARSHAQPAYGVALTHPDRVYWPDAGVTKQGLADYYAEVWDFIAPQVVGRPLALVRCPEGAASPCFFQKHSWAGLSEHIRVVPDPGDTGPEREELLVIESLDGLIGLVQAGVLEIHPWGSRIDDIERPDRLIFDLDPGEGVPWQKVLDATHEIKDRLAAAGLAALVKTTGGKGLHVVAPLVPAADWEEAKDFARAIAESMAKDTPALYVATAAKRLRSGRIFVDYLRNGRGATAVAAYSTRARAGATISTPIAWSELALDLRPDHFRLSNILNRLNHLATDPWAEFAEEARPLAAAGRKAKRRGRGAKS